MANYEAKQIGKVKGLGTAYEVSAPLDKQIEAFNDVGIVSLASPEEEAILRIAGVSNKYSRTSMAPVGVKGEKPILYRVSPFMNPAMTRVAVGAHGSGKYPSLDRDFYEAVEGIAKADEGLEPEDRRAIVLQSSDNFDLSPEMEEARFIFGNSTAKYFDKFSHKVIPFYNLPLEDTPKGKCAVNYLWFDGPQDGSVLDAGDGDLDDDVRASGVLRSAVGASSGISNPTLTQIRKANLEAIPRVFEQEGLSRLSDLVGDSLNRELLETLRKK